MQKGKRSAHVVSISSVRALATDGKDLRSFLAGESAHRDVVTIQTDDGGLVSCRLLSVRAMRYWSDHRCQKKTRPRLHTQ